MYIHTHMYIQGTRFAELVWGWGRGRGFLFHRLLVPNKNTKNE